MKKITFEMIVTSPLTETIRNDFYEIVEILISKNIPATTRETKRFWNSKFTLTCLPSTTIQLAYVNRLGNILEDFSKRRR